MSSQRVTDQRAILTSLPSAYRFKKASGSQISGQDSCDFPVWSSRSAFRLLCGTLVAGVVGFTRYPRRARATATVPAGRHSLRSCHAWAHVFTPSDRPMRVPSAKHRLRRHLAGFLRGPRFHRWNKGEPSLVETMGILFSSFFQGRRSRRSPTSEAALRAFQKELRKGVDRAGGVDVSVDLLGRKIVRLDVLGS